MKTQNLRYLAKYFQNMSGNFCLTDAATLRHLLNIAFLSVIDSCRRDPAESNILYLNLPLAATAKETLSLSSSYITQYNYELTIDEKI